MIAGCSPRQAITIVGAGPAGATAARTLARAGVGVRLLDRSAFPRNKPCGGGLSVRVLSRFPYLGPALARIPKQLIDRLYLEGPDGAAAIIKSDEPAALMIRRLEFDALLVSLAREAGAEVVSGADIVHAVDDATGVTLRARDGRTFTAPLVIAADGVYSVVARRLGINPGWPAASVALDMMEETARTDLRALDPSTLWVAYGYTPHPGRATASHSDRLARGSTPTASQGYAYMFPKRDHVNIGIGYVLSHFREQVAAPPYELQAEFVSQLRDRGLVAGDSVRKNFTPFLIPVGGPLPRPARGRVLLAGDAGGFVNSFTAEGIYYAMVSGDLAARAILASPSRPAAVSARYRRWVDDEIGMELRDSVRIQRYFFADRRRIRAVIDGAHREPAMIRLILDLVVGRRGYRTVRRRMLMRSPRLTGRLLIDRLLRRM